MAGMPEDDAHRQAAKQATLQELQRIVMPSVEEARHRGHVFFDCLLKISVRSMPIKLQFADGQGAYYEKTLGSQKLALKHGFSPTLGDAVDFNAGLRVYIRGLEGIKMLDRGMKGRRVPSKSECIEPDRRRGHKRENRGMTAKCPVCQGGRRVCEDHPR